MCGFCNVWVCICVGFVMYVFVLTVFVLCFFNCFVYVYLFSFVTSVRTTATEWKLNCIK